MRYECEQEYNEEMSAQAQVEMEAIDEHAQFIYEEVSKLEAQKQEIQNEIDRLLSLIP